MRRNVTDGRSLFREIVAETPGEVLAFFDAFISSREAMKLQLEAETLNAAAADEYRTCCAAGADAVLFKWFEVFRNIYIAVKTAESERGLEVFKNPDNFTTFSRSFEPLAFLPEFWFADDSLTRGRDFRDCVYAIRLASERFLYARDGGRAWGACDWEMHRYIRERLCGRLRLGEDRSLMRLAAIALTAHAVASEALGIYIDEFSDVQLPLTGISNVRGQARPLLKYFHYDRYTQLSYAREHEFAADVNFHGDHVEFEQRWLALAVISDFAIKEADAHSTLFCSSRAAFESVSRCMTRIGGKLSRKGVLRMRRTVDAIAGVFSDRDFSAVAKMSQEDVLNAIGVRRKPIDAGHYLEMSGVMDAKGFWNRALPVFDELVTLVNKNRDETVPKYTERQRRAGFRDAGSAAEFIDHAINYSNSSELREIGRGDFLRCFKDMLSGGGYELHPLVLESVVLASDDDRVGNVAVWSDAVGRSRELPPALPFSEGERKEFREWILSMWTDLAKRCPIEDSESGSKGRHGVDFTKFDFRKILAGADRLWDHYLSADKACMERWVLSVSRALEIIRVCDENNYDSWRFKTGFVWPCNASRRRILRSRLMKERQDLVKMGVWPKNMEKLRASFLKREPVTIDTVASKADRYYVMIAVFARLMVETAEHYPGLWGNKEELFSFFMHILIATNDSLESPMPCHLGIFRDSYLRVARSRTRQRNAVDAIVDGRFGNEAERQIMIMFLAHYLKKSGRRGDVAASIAREDAIAAYFGKFRLNFLLDRFGEGREG